MSRHVRVIACTVLTMVLMAASPVRAGEPEAPSWIPLSKVMSELSENPEFVNGILRRLGQDPNDGGILGPRQIRRLRELILGKNWEAIDRFPGLTVTGLGRSVRLAAAARGYLTEKPDDPAQAAPDETVASPAGDSSEDLGLPANGPPLAPDTYLRPLGFGLEAGDRVDPAGAVTHADALRLAQVLNRLALNPGAGEPGARYRVELEGESVDAPQDLIKVLATSGHDVDVRDARYFANFGDLIYQGRDVLTPFWLDTEIRVPGTQRSLLVPVGHSQHEIRVQGPVVNANLSFYFGIDGRAEFRPIDTLDQAWVLGRVAHVYHDNDALEVVRLAGEIVKSYAAVRDAHPDLPFGGYYALGVCNDVNAMIELSMQGRTTLFPLTLDAQYFATDGEVSSLARQLPIDGRTAAGPDVQRIFGSLPVEDLADIPLPDLRRDLQLVQAAWANGDVEFTTSWRVLPWALVAGLLVVLHLVATGWRLYRTRLDVKPEPA